MDRATGKILVVDDDRLARLLLSTSLEEEGYQVETADNGKTGLKMLEEHEYDMLLLDLLMPEMNGYEVLEQLNTNGLLYRMPVVVISALDDLESTVKCIEMGADDYIFKPFERVLLKARVSASLEKKRLRDREIMYRKQIEDYNLYLEQRVREQVQEISAAQLATNLALAKLAESRDHETGMHLERVREYSRVLLQQLRRRPVYAKAIDDQFIENVYAASVLHDIGKVGIPDSILLKPTSLSVDEFEIMKKHTTIGAETLRTVDRLYPRNRFLIIGIQIAESHHEHWNGQGYPFGLSKTAIPLAGRVMALADVYDALISKRVYKVPWSHQASVRHIVDQRGLHFDPDVVDCFIELEQTFVDIATRFKD